MSNLTFSDVMVAAGVPATETEYVLWNRTPFPFDPTPKRLYKCASSYVRACKNGRQLCELCRNQIDGDDKWNCKSCCRALGGGQ